MLSIKMLIATPRVNLQLQNQVITKSLVNIPELLEMKKLDEQLTEKLAEKILNELKQL